MTVDVMNFRADTCYLHREYGRSSCLLCSITLKTELQWLGPLYRYLFVVATYTFYTLSQMPNRKGNRMYISPDVDAKGLDYHLGPLSIVRFRVFRVEQCLISVGRGSGRRSAHHAPI